MSRKQKRFVMILGGMAFVFFAVILVLFSLGSSMSYFYVPADLKNIKLSPQTRIRLGGRVKVGSWVRAKDGIASTFVITDTIANVKVAYSGLFPDLFREGQDVIAEGHFKKGGKIFLADTVLAKHDETYIPKNVADRLKAHGVKLYGKEGVK